MWDMSVVPCLGAEDREVGLVAGEECIRERKSYVDINIEAERRISLGQNKG